MNEIAAALNGIDHQLQLLNANIKQVSDHLDTIALRLEPVDQIAFRLKGVAKAIDSFNSVYDQINSD